MTSALPALGRDDAEALDLNYTAGERTSERERGGRRGGGRT